MSHSGGAESLVRNEAKGGSTRSAASLETNPASDLAAQGADEQSEVAGGESSIVDQRKGISKRPSTDERSHEGTGGCGDQ